MKSVDAFTPMEKTSACVRFLKDMIGIDEIYTLHTISIESFEIWIIDNGFVEDPGTSDQRSLIHKGFNIEKGRIKGILNRWSEKHLTEGQSFVIEKNKDMQDTYNLVPWTDNTMAFANDIGNRVERYSKNKLVRVSQLKDAATSQIKNPEHQKEILDMLGMVEGYGIVMQRSIRAEVEKFNTAIKAVEHLIEN